MIRFERTISTDTLGLGSEVLEARGVGPTRVTSAPLEDAAARREQAFSLIDAAAALLDDQDEFIGEFDELHEIMDRLRGE